MTLNPGMAVVLDSKFALSLSTAPTNLNELFRVSQDPSRSCVLCLTTGAVTRGSWLNALSSEPKASATQNEHIVSESSSDQAEDYPLKGKPNLNLNQLSKNRKDGHSIRDRLEQLGATLKNKALWIRVAPAKNCNLLPDFLESKANLIEKWISNIKALNPDITLPEVKRVVPVWETPRSGERVRIIKILLKSKKGLQGMKDLMQGSK